MRDASEVTTRKLYYEDAYRTAFEATVLSAERGVGEGGAPCLDVTLDETCFFPEEGGQSPDRGVLMGYPVTDVRIRDGEIHHFVGCSKDADADMDFLAEDARAESRRSGMDALAAAFLPGRQVKGEIDWSERFSNMQQHSGEHIFSGIVHRRYGFENVGFHLSASEVTLDFDGVIPREDIPDIEREANAVIWKNLETEIRMTTREERETLIYRSKLDLDGEVRIVTFPGVDSCACCAPHVRRTGEIGLLKVISVINWKGGVRVSILCGERALAAYQKDHSVLTETAQYLTTAAENVPAQVVRMREEIRELRGELQKSAARELLLMAETAPAEEANIALFSVQANDGAAREVVNALTEKRAGYCGIFIGNDTDGYRYVIGSAARDCREMAASLREHFGARGGGKSGMIEGSLKAGEASIRELFRD